MSCVHRYRSLLRAFQGKHADKKLEDDMYHEYLFHLLVDLRDVYDDNEQKLRIAALNKDNGQRRQHELYLAREKTLQKVSVWLRRELHLLKADYSPKEKTWEGNRDIHGIRSRRKHHRSNTGFSDEQGVSDFAVADRVSVRV